MGKETTYGVWAVRSGASIFGHAEAWCKEDGKPLEFDSREAAEAFVVPTCEVNLVGLVSAAWQASALIPTRYQLSPYSIRVGFHLPRTNTSKHSPQCKPP